MAARIPIPEYQAKDAPTFIPGAPRTPDTRQVSLGPQIEHAGDALQEYAQKFKKDTDETAVNDAYANQFSPAFRNLYGDYYNLQGKDAVDQRPGVEAKMQQLRETTRDSLKSPDQQRLFDDMSRRRVEVELDGMARHAAQERRVWMGQTHDATLETLTTQAADKYNDENAFAGALRSGLDEVDRYGTTTGKPAEWVRAQGEKFVSNAWVQRVERMSLNDPVSAQKLYQAHVTEVAPAARPVLEQRLKSAVLPVQAKQIADDFVADDGTSKDVKASLGDTLKAAGQRAEELRPNDPVFAAMVDHEVKSRISTAALVRQGVEDQATQTALNYALKTKATSVESLQRDPEASKAWQLMRPQAQLGVIGVLNHNLHEAQNGGQAMRLDGKTFQALNDAISLPDGDPNKITSATQIAPYIARGLNIPAFNFLQQRLDQLRTDSGQRFDKTREDFFKSVHKQFDTSTLVKDDPMGGEDFYKFKAYAADKEAQFRKDGKDPYALFTPSSPDYLGKQMAPFMRSEAQKMTDYMQRLRSAAPTAPKPLPPDQQRKPGEPLADYAKRTGMTK